MDAIDRVESAALVRGPAAPHRPTMEEAVRGFESLLLHQTLKGGSHSFSKGGVFDGGSAGRLFRDLFLEEVARIAVGQRGLGVVPGLSLNDSDQRLDPSSK